MSVRLPIDFGELRDKALALGWDDIGITKPEVSLESIQSYKHWIDLGYQAELTYMENAMRCFPEQLFPGAKRAVIFVTYYKQDPVSFKENTGVIASYARGRDYHHLHRRRLKKIILWLEERSGQQGIAKGFSDSTPIMEKALAVQAGLGWFGKNTLLIHRRFGTFILLSGLLTSLEIDEPTMSLRLPRCGVCTRCLDACPTGAIVNPYELDAGRCLSYHTIESKKEIPEEIKNRNPGYIFGCDICQDVCPHNVKKPTSPLFELNPSQGAGPYLNKEQLKILEEHPEKLFGTPLQRRGVEGLKYTLDTIKKT